MRLEKGRIVWVNLEDGKGSEQKGTSRPCAIVQNNIGNKFAATTIVVPLTRRIPKRLLPTHLVIKGQNLGKNYDDSIALAEQIKVVDTKRIQRIDGKLSDFVIKELDQKMMISLGITGLVS